MKDHVASLRASLKVAPAKGPVAVSAKTIIAAMRGDLVKARRDKNWTTSDLREWLAGEGVVVSGETLRKYLAMPRKAASLDEGRPDARGARSEVKLSTAQGCVAKPPGRLGRHVDEASQVTRASSFSVREDTLDI